SGPSRLKRLVREPPAWGCVCAVRRPVSVSVIWKKSASPGVRMLSVTTPVGGRRTAVARVFPVNRVRSSRRSTCNRRRNRQGDTTPDERPPRVAVQPRFQSGDHQRRAMVASPKRERIRLPTYLVWSGHASLFAGRLRYIEQAIDSDAQTERRGEARPVK